MSDFDIDGDIQINGSEHTVQYEPSAMVGGATLFLRVKDGNKNVPIFYNEINEVIQMLQKGKLMISALEGEKLIEPKPPEKINGATHWAVLPDDGVIYYKVGDEVMLWKPFSEVWESPNTVPYTLHCFDDYDS